jgi:hypothetical protein
LSRGSQLPSGKRLAAVVLLTVAAGTLSAAAPARDRPGAGWLVVDYSELIDRRLPSHSGESIGALLERLAGRPLPPPGQRPADHNAHVLLDPALERYAFVLSDALDSLGVFHTPPWIEVGSLWQPGEAQPAWVELLRARRYVVESDGTGNFRAILPWDHGSDDQAVPAEDSAAAAGAAWDAAWPILRHVFAAERRRLSRGGEPFPELAVEVHAFRHVPEHSVFQLGSGARHLTLADTRTYGRRPILDLEGLRAFLDSGLRLEGARLDRDGGLRLLGSRSARPPELLGGPIALADLAVAYRAVFHGGLSEAYMSLDRGYSPQIALVHYGGRLRDTSLGLVSLLCDIRFKTFSLGLDIAQGRDRREELRRSLPAFRTHLERMAADQNSAGVFVSGQQTRMWFYPDAVDLTLSEQGDVLVLRSVRMTAASERVGETGLPAAGQSPEWTRATVQAINDDYDALQEFFPELSDLDEVVRLLSLFAWLKQAESDGLLLPDLNSLLAVELPQLSTPRTYPQLLAFNALPPPDSSVPVTVFDRVPVAEALDRLNPASGRPFPARRRYQRAVAGLNPELQDDAKLLAEFQRFDAERLSDDQLDLLAQRAERVRMHTTVIATLESPQRREIGERMRRGESFRIFSGGIGGLDLGMGAVVTRARARRLGLAAGAHPGGPDTTLVAGAASREPREEWRDDPPGLPATLLPDHGPGTAGTAQNRVVVGDGSPGWILVLYGADGPEVRARRVFLDGSRRTVRFVRTDEMRVLSYAIERDGNRLTVRRAEPPPFAGRQLASTGRPLAAGLMLLHVGASSDGVLESPGVVLRLESWVSGTTRNFEAEFPRRLLQRLVLGRSVDLTPERPLVGLSPLPGPPGAVETLMVLPAPDLWKPPWEHPPALLAGEENPWRLARAFKDWWAATGPEAPAAVVGTDRDRSPERWATAPRPDARSLLLLPPDGFIGRDAAWRSELEAAWGPRGVAAELPDDPRGPLVVLISAEPPGVFARRVRDLAGDPRLRGRLLAAWCLSGSVRQDLPASLLEDGNLAALGVAEDSVVDRRGAVETLRMLDRALSEVDSAELRVERLPGPFLWHF